MPIPKFESMHQHGIFHARKRIHLVLTRRATEGRLEMLFMASYPGRKGCGDRRGWVAGPYTPQCRLVGTGCKT